MSAASDPARILDLRAGPGAAEHLRANGIAPADVACIPAAAGGPKGLALIPTDKLLYREWLRDTGPIELIGASVGAWRMAALAQPDPVAALDRLAHTYVRDQNYAERPGPQDVAEAVTRIARAVLDGRALEVREGVALERAKVGDRYVLEKLTEKKWLLGGENSGHLICRDRHTTGDAVVAALAVLRALIEQDTTLAQATAPVHMFPQRLINVPIARGWDWKGHPAVRKAESHATKALGDAGRVLLRPSGTEPVLRVMVEARSRELAETHAQAIAETIAKAAGMRL